MSLPAPTLRAPHGRAGLMELDGETLSTACRNLRDQMAEAGISPTHVVGIANAGVHVARSFAETLNHRPLLLTARSQRPTSPLKDRVAKARLVRRLPEWSIQILRRLELRLLTQRLPGIRDVAMSEDDLAELLRAPAGSTVLVIDDCVDTGATLRAVLHFVARSLEEGCLLFGATLGATVEKPLVIPNFIFQEDLVIGIRGPWSRDAKT